MYPHVTACFRYASVGVKVHFVSPQDKGTVRHLDISPTAEQSPFSLLTACLETNTSSLDIPTILSDSGGDKAG